MAKSIYTLAETANVFGVDENEIRRMSAAGSLSPVRSRNGMQFKADDVEKRASEHFAKRLRGVLVKGLRDAGVRVSVEVEPIEGTRLHRVFVVSNQRDKLEPSEWDTLLWRLIDAEFGSNANTRITTIYTVTPAELRRYRANEEAETARA